jgi:hypothetical protein
MANMIEMGTMMEINGIRMKRKGKSRFSTERPKVTRISERRTSCDITITALMTQKTVTNCGMISKIR